MVGSDTKPRANPVGFCVAVGFCHTSTNTNLNVERLAAFIPNRWRSLQRIRSFKSRRSRKVLCLCG